MSLFLELFSSYICHLPSGKVDASRVLSLDCYLHFCQVRATLEECTSDHPHAFINTLTAHVCASTLNHLPFKPTEERALLNLLRTTGKNWPCFPAEVPAYMFPGPFAGKGYHESNPVPQATDTEFDLQQPDDFILIADLAERIVYISSSDREFDLESWKTALDIIRFVVLARTKAVCCTTTSEVAYELCEKASRAANAAVIVQDFRERDFYKRNVAQIGTIEALLTPLMMIHEKDLFRVTLALLNSFFRPGVAFPLCQRLQVGNVFKQFNVLYTVDPGTFLLVVVIKPHGL